jgi:DNA-binding response OmpR family regulator
MHHRGCEEAERKVGPRPRLGNTVLVRVLVVEDERRLATAVKRGLEAEGFVVGLAHDGPAGLHRARGRLRQHRARHHAARAVRRGERPVELTTREFALLEYLLRRAGQVVPKTELLSHVWEAEDIADLNVVEVYIGYLRRKIDTPFRRHAVQTVRGAGYRLAADGG